MFQCEHVPRTGSWIKRALYVLTPILILSTLIAVHQLKDNSEMISLSQNEAIWFILQLTKEYSEFIYQLQSYQFGNTSHDAMMIQYEILWSRFNTITHNDLVVHLSQFNGLIPAFTARFEQVQAIEPQLLSLPTTGNFEPVVQYIRTDFESLVTFLNEKFRLTSGDMSVRIQAIAEIEQVIQFLLFSTFLMGSLMAYVLLRESRNHHFLAMNDSLTGLHNRLWLNHKLRELESMNQPFTFYLIDLDGFKTINDTLGHQAGDELLTTVAKRLSRLNCQHYFAARMGGDEFAVIELCGPTNTAHKPTCIPEQLAAVFRRPARYAGKRHDISASIGASQFPDSAHSISELLRQADFAMYEVKQAGKDGLRYFQQPPLTEMARGVKDEGAPTPTSSLLH
ncbi:GGDEF domain-containing protein [Photobacterium atrarenae]|uniref:GGDEF domain-containing protein n=1 Tax=Photobacterium atrarenae TaxID=865757 RepID=A0ABY5GJ59_9GAMM|nr:GGDEF domain-containing protein [Photobacterium atrarenae]UTV28617.1 GGDEF domain-containing protein [Photobacterium atrarenae]